MEQPPPGKEKRRLRAACALALYAPTSERWEKVRDAVAGDLVGVPAVHLARWMAALRPVSERLLSSLTTIFRDRQRHETERSLATDVLVDYAADAPETLVDVLLDADERAWAKLWTKAQAHKERTIGLCIRELDRSLAPDWKDAPLVPGWGQPDGDIVRRLEEATGLVRERFALCQTLPLADFEGLTQRMQKVGYRPVQLRPYIAGDRMLAAAVWVRDGGEGLWALDVKSQGIAQRDKEAKARGLVPLDVSGYVPPGGDPSEPCHAVLWGPKEPEAEDVKMFVDVPAARFRAAWEPLQKGGYLPRTQGKVDAAVSWRHSEIWWKPKRSLETKEYAHSHDEEDYEKKKSPSHLQLDLRLIANPARLQPPRRLGLAALSAAPQVGLAGVPWGPLVRGQEMAARGLPGVDFSAVWIDSATQVSEAVHGLEPPAHLVRCRELAAQSYRPQAITVLESGRWLAGSVWSRPVVPEPARDALAKRQAQAAVALVQLGAPERVWPLLEHTPDPRVRSFLIHRFEPLKTERLALWQRLQEERDVSRRRALMLALGSYPVEKDWLPQLRRWYREEPDAGLHGAVEWLLRRWGDGAEIARLDRELAGARLTPGEVRSWQVNGQGQTYVRIPGPSEFWMGSPGSEAGRTVVNEPLHRVHVPRSFWLATKEVTVEQFLKFRANHRYTVRTSPYPDGPMGSVTWYDAAAYCNWLSDQEGIPESEWCYIPLAGGDYAAGMRLAPGALEKRGYRLPTEAEWECACRAGVVTSRYYGESDELLGQYAWYTKTTNDQSVRPGGLLKPNDRGLFDLYGNVFEWVMDPALLYRWQFGIAKVDKLRIEDIRGIKEENSRLLRGGSFVSQASFVRSAVRLTVRPSIVYYGAGLRPARTYH